MIENTTPILRVECLDASLSYYSEKLGFTVAWSEGGAAGILRDDKGLMLLERTQGNPGTWVWIGVHDAQVLFEEYVAACAIIRHPPLNFPWALEFKVEDPDGHVLRFGSGSIEGREFDEWAE